MSAPKAQAPPLACPLCYSVFTWDKRDAVSSAPSYTIDVPAAMDRTLPKLGSVTSLLIARAAHEAQVSAATAAAAERDRTEDVDAHAPRQLPDCGHVLCTSCLTLAYIEAYEDARFDPDAPVDTSAGAPTQRLTQAQLNEWARKRDDAVEGIPCPVLTCSSTSPVGCVLDVPVLLPVAKHAATSRVEWSVEGGEQIAKEWKEKVVDDSAERARAALIASTDCLGNLRGDCTRNVKDTSVQPSTTPLDPTDRSEPSASASGPGGRDHELCTFRHPPLVAVQRGVICRQWLKTGVCGGSCRQLHPSPGLIERTDCLSSSHPRLFCNGRRFGQPCPFRHDDPLGRYKPQAAVCTRWADYACNDPLCPFAHPYERPEPTGAASKTKLKRKGNVGVFWDMISCPIPPDNWPYGTAMAFDRLLRKAGYFTTGPGWTMHFTCYGNGITPELLAQLSTARAEVKETQPDPKDPDSTNMNVGVSVSLDHDMMEFVRTFKTTGVACIVVASSSPRLVSSFERLTHKDVHVVLISPDMDSAPPELMAAASECIPWVSVAEMAHASPPLDVLERAAMLQPKVTFAPKPDGPPPCPSFKPAIQTGCPAGDACVYFHEKRPCRTMLMAVADCPFANDCPFRHVPLPTPEGKLAYKEVATSLRGVPNGTSGVTWNKRNVRMLYTRPRHDGSKYSASATKTAQAKFVTPPGYWTCAMCTYKFNPPLPTGPVVPLVVTPVVPVGEEGTVVTASATVPVVDTLDTPCANCGATYRDAGCNPAKPPADKVTVKGCWFCPVCLFGGNTVGKNLNCQVCKSPGGERARGLSKLWYCSECQYLNDDVVTTCDVCRSAKPGSWCIKYKGDE